MWPPGATLAPRGMRGDCKAGHGGQEKPNRAAITHCVWLWILLPAVRSWDSSFSPSFSKEDAGKPWVPLTLVYICLPAAFLHREAGVEMESWKPAAWEGCSLFDHLLILPYMREVGASSNPHLDEHPVVLFSTEERFCSCFKCKSCPFSFGHGIQTWGFHHVAFLVLLILWAQFSVS